MNIKRKLYSEDNPYAQNPYDTGGYRAVENIVSPLLALAEVIGTKGASRGDTALALGKNIGSRRQEYEQQANEWEALQQQARQNALEREMKQEEATRQKEEFDWKKQKATAEQNYMTELDKLKDIADPVERYKKNAEIDARYGKKSYAPVVPEEQYPELPKGLKMYDPVLQGLYESGTKGSKSAWKEFWRLYKPKEEKIDKNALPEGDIVGYDENDNPVIDYSTPKDKILGFIKTDPTIVPQREVMTAKMTAANYSKMKFLLDSMLDGYEKYGTEFVTDPGGKMAALSSQMSAIVKNQIGLGVLSKTDFEYLESIIPSPATFKATLMTGLKQLTGGYTMDPVKPKLDILRESTNSAFNNEMYLHGGYQINPDDKLWNMKQELKEFAPQFKKIVSPTQRGTSGQKNLKTWTIEEVKE